ncbi:MAG: hypothetical protein ACI9A7_002060 [Cyclobacteriaceae bacterium]|jgi:hypothetical protein
MASSSRLAHSSEFNSNGDQGVLMFVIIFFKVEINDSFQIKKSEFSSQCHQYH